MHRVIRDHLEEVLADASAARAAHSASHGKLEYENTRPNRSQDWGEHLRQCDECRAEVEFMRQHATLLRALRADFVPESEAAPEIERPMEPRAGFYARVMERIEAHQPGSFWSVFSDSPFGRRIAVASMTLALVFGVYLFASEKYLDQQPDSAASEISAPQAMPVSLTGGEDQPGLVLGRSGAPDRDAVLVNLVTYREQ
jgi:hypothetical protein